MQKVASDFSDMVRFMDKPRLIAMREFPRAKFIRRGGSRSKNNWLDAGLMNAIPPKDEWRRDNSNSLMALASAAQAAEGCSMKPLTTEEIRELRADIAYLGFSEEKMDEYIRLIDFCAISLVDHFHSVSSVKLSLLKKGSYSFAKAEDSAKLLESKGSETVDLDIEGATDTPITKRPREP